MQFVLAIPARMDKWHRVIRRFFARTLDIVLLTLVRSILFFVPAASRNLAVRRSLWAGTPIITLSLKARSERILGIQADSLVFQTYFVTSAFDYNFGKWMRWPILRNILPYAVLLWACVRYQRFHFFLDRGLLPPRQRFEFHQGELKLLHRLGKEIYFWTYGADVRTQSRTRMLGKYQCCLDCPRPGLSCVCDDELAQSRYEKIIRHATDVFSMGDMIEYTPGSRNDLYFWPVDLDADNGRKFTVHYPDQSSDEPIRIVHAPNHRAFKGTRFLLAAVENLKRKGCQLELRLVEKIPNSEAIKIYRSADLIFDQCLIGFHGYFALEAMAMGKPVMTYIRRREYLLAPNECPLINASADQVETVLAELVQNRSRLYELGVAGRKYVERHFTLDAFAARLQSVYEQKAV